MKCRSTLPLGALVLALVLLPTVRTLAAEPQGRNAAVLHRAQETFERLRAELARVNAEVADLKRSERSVRNDYRLRERMADAEALARKVTEAETKLRALGGGRVPTRNASPVVEPPQVSPQDGIVELEAKADLFVDQARKLDGEADGLTKAADQLRTRKALRRRAGNWERDPFSGLETSRRNVAVSASAQKASTAETATRGGSAASASPTPGVGTSGGSNPAPILEPATVPPPTLATADSTSKASGAASSSEGAAASKSSPLPLALSADRQPVEQRLYLDPATTAALRQALGAPGAASDPDALDRAAAALRARARTLRSQAQALHTNTRVP
jgi:hypothetical protein